jgi:hypothetical protein
MLISLTTIKTHLQLDKTPDSDLDAYLEGLYDAALDYCEQYLGREIPWNTSTASEVFPASIQRAMLLLIGDYHENREGQALGQSYSTNPAVEKLLHFHRTGLGI